MKSYWEDRTPWRRRDGETYLAWLGRIMTFRIDYPPLTAAERRSIDQAPACHICGAPVFLTDGQRLDITHDYFRHSPRRDTTPAPPRRGLFGRLLRPEDASHYDGEAA